MGFFGSKKWKIVLWIFAMLLVFIVGGIGGVFMDKYAFPRLASSPFFSKMKFLKEATENVTIINKTEQVTIREDDSINQIASRASTTVVSIVSIGTKKAAYQFSPAAEMKNGAGILVTSDGVIVTYRDAIFEKDSSYMVILNNNDKYEATLMGVDEFTNLAYLKIDATNLPSIDFANSDDFKPGKKLISIGISDGQYENKFSAGLLSNINRTFNLSGKSLSFSDKLEGVFEVDFDNQHSYLGGPAISYGGSLVGIVGKISIDNKDFFFLIPSNIVKDSLNSVLNGEISQRPSAGLYYKSITKEVEVFQKTPKEKGALLYSPSGSSSLIFIDNSPAQKAGLRLGDIITEVEGKTVDLFNPLSNLLSHYKKGEKLELTIFRDGKDMKVTLQL